MSTESGVMLIAGGSGSIGRALAILAASEGWHVAIHGHRQSRVDAAIDEVLAQNPKATLSGHVADFSQGPEIIALIGDVMKAHGKIDAVVDCSVSAPTDVTGPFANTVPDQYSALSNLSVVAFQRLAHASLSAITKTRGCYVALVSDAGIHAAAHQSMIGAMRAGSIGFVRNLAMEVARDGVRVNAVSPSFVEETEIAAQLATSSPARLEKARARAGLGLPTAQDVALLALFLCSRNAAKITGQVISINGGLNA